ncbi:uncharacterized protein [Amphiura filiformis]|uniref:uncharacterized protein n=1 Tax=Amphiura filiformis TaxID=82378 RepID=UPI003B211316
MGLTPLSAIGMLDTGMLDTASAPTSPYPMSEGSTTSEMNYFVPCIGCEMLEPRVAALEGIVAALKHQLNTAPRPAQPHAPAPQQAPPEPQCARAPAPQREPAPAPQREPAPAPQREPAPAPQREPAPAPQREPAPAQEPQQAPAHDPAPLAPRQVNVQAPPHAPPPPPLPFNAHLTVAEVDENGRVVRVELTEELHEDVLLLVEQGREAMSRFLVRSLFTVEERLERNCTGRSGKRCLDPVRLDAIKLTVFAVIPCARAERITAWKSCIRSIDSMNRNLKHHQNAPGPQH